LNAVRYESFVAEDQALLGDPQTSGGLLVSCAPAALDAMLASIRRHGFAQAAAVGNIAASHATPLLVLR
jgi:selenide,water dikinase